MDGHWEGDYGGPHFLLPGLIFVWYVTGRQRSILPKSYIAAMRHYLTVHQQKDGGWGTHIESPSTMFGSTINYISLRLLGMPADDPVAVKGREFIRGNGGAVYAASWSKFFMCLLGGVFSPAATDIFSCPGFSSIQLLFFLFFFSLCILRFGVWQ